MGSLSDLSPNLRASIAASQSMEGEESMPAARPYVIPIGNLGANQQVTINLTGVPTQGESFETCTYVDYTPSICTTIAIARPQWSFAVAVTNAEGEPIRQAYACELLYVRYYVRNIGDADTEPVMITQTLPEGFATADDGREISIDAGVLRAGSADAELVQVGDPIEVQPTGPGVFFASATATDGTLTAEDVTDRVVIVQPEIDVTIDGPARVALGSGDPRYTVTVTNTSDVIAPNTQVAITVPEGAGTGFRPMNTQRVTYENDMFNVGDLPAGASRSFDFTFQPAMGGEIAMSAQADAYCAEAVTAQLTTNIIALPSFQIEMIDGEDSVPVGEEIVYAIEITNEGKATSNMQLTAQLPEGVEFVSGSGTTDVSGGEGRTVNFGPIPEFEPNIGDPARWRVVAKANTEGQKVFSVTLTSEGLDQPISEEESTNVLPATPE